jgi:hypothetical protein
MKPTAPLRNNFSVLAPDPARGLSLSRSMVTRPICIGVLTTLAVVCSSIAYADEPHLRALEAKAVCVALAQYQATSPKADLRHFQIIVGKEGKNFDIIFLPDPDPTDPHPVGGSTKYGAEVHYIISPRTYKILKMHLAR